MTRLICVWLTGCALCVTPVAAEEDVYDGPTAIRPLTVTPKPQHSPAQPCLRFRASVLPGEGRGPSSCGSPSRGRQARRSPSRQARRSPSRQARRSPQSWPQSASLRQSWPPSARLRQSWPPSAPLPDPKYPMNLSSRRGATAWIGPCRTTSSRTTFTPPCGWLWGAVRRRCGWSSRVASITPV